MTWCIFSDFLAYTLPPPRNQRGCKLLHSHKYIYLSAYWDCLIREYTGFIYNMLLFIFDQYKGTLNPNSETIRDVTVYIYICGFGLKFGTVLSVVNHSARNTLFSILVNEMSVFSSQAKSKLANFCVCVRLYHYA